MSHLRHDSIRENAIRDAIERTYDPDPAVRRGALHDLCPCEVRADFVEAWQRVLEMADDNDPRVRKQVLHNLCDGSPEVYLPDILEKLENFARDPVPRIGRIARRVRGHYRRTGKINIR